VPGHVDRGFRHPRSRRFVGLSACGSAFANGEQHAAVVACGLHGLLAVGGLSCLALALRGPPRGLDQGVASFGIIATSLITLAALIGVALLATRIFKTRIAGIMIGIHATLAVGGFVILTAYVLLG